MLLSCGQKILDLSTPKVMGVLNITPNSFSTVGRFTKVADVLPYAQQMVRDGAAIIDIGAEPTNPGVYPVVSLQEELDRLIPVVEILSKELSVPLSVDTSKPAVMQEAILHGASFINDVRGLQNSEALKIAANAGVGVCVMHMAYPEGKPDTENSFFGDQDAVTVVRDFLQARIEACVQAGIQRDRIVIDPGIGHGNFGKNLAENLCLLRHLDQFTMLGVPVLIGVSRKTFIGELLDLPVEERLYGSLAAATVAVMKGAAIIRAHDVRATVEAVGVAAAIGENH